MHEPLLDFETVDLSRAVFGRADLDQACLQRGRFRLLDGVLHFDQSGGLCVGYQDLTPEDWWAADHIPGRPLFPGALLCEGAAQLCTFDFMRRRPNLQGTFVGFGGLNEVRFRGMVAPPCRLLYAVRAHRVREKLFTYRAQAFVLRKLVFEGEILGVAL